ncbi:hypothetical protein [Streptomyces sp. DH24]|uniref:hypothetical protein n=1 Tax=Streptomyces sp. DH24 TaxID=3040123 RepID=UPI002441F09E|nr:hypothetical protein [Streptomyces sp. DH24]MDG9716446.1 hypothetical protein [Streptomyces sp. DH24]
MSRETDSPSTGPNGRGGAAYPSGTPPYGTPTGADGGAEAGRSATQPEERKTETQLTTRVRINIPGSRPIPPVVVRKPVGDSDGGRADQDAESAPAPASGPAASAAPPAAPGPQAEEKTSDWFAPRKSVSPKGGQGAGAANGAGRPGGSAAPAGPGPAAAGSGASGAGAARPGGAAGSMNAPGGARPGGANGAGRSGATGGPVAPGHGGGTGSFDVTEALAAGPLGGGPRPGPDADAGRDGLPYFADGGHGEQTGRQPRVDQNGRPVHGGPHDFTDPGPAGPTGGPVTGGSALTPPLGTGPGGLGGPGLIGGPGGPAGPGAAPGSGHGPGGGLSDDTAILTPQKPAPEPDGHGYGHPGDNVSGHTLTSGIPVVPTDRNAPYGSDVPSDGPLRHTPPKLPDPVPPPSASSAKPPKKGRNKLVLLCGGVVFLAGVAYGAGLLMNHSDVPKGTTVLGVDIGGGTRDDAVEKLDAAFEDRVAKPLKLTVSGRTVELTPDQAGLQFDMQATVAEAAKSDYNPVSVIGSLFGNHRVVEPVMPVDEEKLHAALQDAAGGSGSVTEGTIRFESGRAVPVYPKAGKGIHVARAAGVVEQAYRGQVETGAFSPVNVPTSIQQPKVSKAEVDRMMKEFAEPAMSANVTVQTDAAHSVPMSPQKSLWKFLRVEAVNGKLVDKPDLAALKNLYGQAFDDVRITRGNGEKTPVTPQDVYVALRQVLTSRTDRVAVIETNPN